MSKFSEKLKAERKRVGLSQQKIADLIGIARTNYIPYENGDVLPSIYTIPKLAKALGVSIQDLFDWMAEELGE